MYIAKNNDTSIDHVGQTVTLNRSIVATSKAALENLLNSTRNGNALTRASLMSTGQVLSAANGTSVKITYAELFRSMLVFQALVLDGKYKGRSVWVTEHQIHWATPLPTNKAVPVPVDGDDMDYTIPSGMGSGVETGGADPGESK